MTNAEQRPSKVYFGPMTETEKVQRNMNVASVMSFWGGFEAFNLV